MGTNAILHHSVEPEGEILPSEKNGLCPIFFNFPPCLPFPQILQNLTLLKILFPIFLPDQLHYVA